MRAKFCAATEAALTHKPTQNTPNAKPISVTKIAAASAGTT
jgi:hypothetical protein